MQERLRGYANDILARWNALEKTQKIKLIVTVLMFVLALGVTLYLTTRPRMYKLFTNQDWTTIAQIQNALNESGIYNKPTDNGTSIEVREKDAATAAIELSVKNVPSGGTFTYADALSSSGMGTTETIKQENLRRAKESDLSSNLTIFEGVDSAIVTLAIPREDNYFQETTQKPSASVALKLSQNLSKSQGQAIALYVSRSVKNLSMDDIEIRDQHANIVYSGVQDQSGGTSTQRDQEAQYANDMSAIIRGTLSPMFDEVMVAPHLVLNWNKVVENSTAYSSPVTDSDSGLISRQAIDKESVTGGTTGNEPGLNANDQATTNYDTGTNNSSSASVNKSETDYLHNQVNRVTESSVGDVVVDQSSIAVTLYKYILVDEESMTNSDRLNGMTWEDYKTANWASTPFEVDQGVIDMISKGTGITDLTVNGYAVPVFRDREITPIKVEQIVMFSILALLILLLAFGLIRSTQPVEVTEVEPELSVEDLLVSTQLEEQKEAEAEKLQDIDFTKESESKKQIEKFVQDKPEAVAQLLRNWLNEGWES